VTRRTALFFAAAAALGVGVAAAVVATRDDGARTAQPTSTAAAATTRARAKATLVSNQIRLSHAASLRLVDWADRLRACESRRGVVLAAPVPHETEIDLAIRRGPTGQALLMRVVACGDALGGPPPKSSLQLRGRKFVLYLPKRCLLDKRVVRGGTTS
jgi:hypothetical protein